MDSNKIMTSKEYTAWLEVSLVSALNVIEEQEKTIKNLCMEKGTLQTELFLTQRQLERVYPLVTKDIRV